MEETEERQDPQAPSLDLVANFAADLRELRQLAATPSFRAMENLAMKAGYERSHTSLAEAVKGDALPSWGTVEAFVVACKARPSDWKDRWERAEALSKGRSFDDGMSAVPASEAEDPALYRPGMEPDSPHGELEERPQVEAPLSQRRHARMVILALSAAVILLVAGVLYVLFSGSPAASGKPAASGNPSAVLQATVSTPTANAVLQRCIQMTGSAKLPTGWELWLAVQVPNKDNNPDRYYLLGRLTPGADGTWKTPTFSLGSEADVGRPYWLKVVSSDLSITGPINPQDFNDVAMTQLPKGFDPTPLADVPVKRATHNLPGQTCP